MNKSTAAKKAEEIRALVKQQRLEVEPLFDLEAEEEVCMKKENIRHPFLIFLQLSPSSVLSVSLLRMLFGTSS